MQQLTMLVTADGRWVLPDSEDFLAALGDPEPDYDAIGFAVRNLGFIKFQVLDRIVTEIELHPRNVDRRALLAVEGLLGDAGTNLFRLKYLTDSWHSEISPSARHTVARLRELCAPVFEPQPTERFHVDPKDPAVLFDAAHRTEGFGPMAMKWRVSFGTFDPANVMRLIERSDLLPLFAIVGFERRDRQPIFRFLGGAHRWGGDAYRLDGLERPIADMPDREYGAWVARFYDAVGNSYQPRYDLVTAQMEYHAEAGTPRRLVRYERLLLPWRTTSGDVLVTSCTRLVPREPAANLRDDGSDSSSSMKPPKSS